MGRSAHSWRVFSGPPGPCRRARTGRTLGLLPRQLGGDREPKGGAMVSMRRGWRAVRTLTLMTTTLIGGAVGLTSAAQVASASTTTSRAAATTPVTAPGILAPPDVVVGAADGSVLLKVRLTAPGVNPVTVNYATADGTTASNSFCSGTGYGYLGQRGTLTFQPGVTTQTVRVPRSTAGPASAPASASSPSTSAATAQTPPSPGPAPRSTSPATPPPPPHPASTSATP